MLFADGKLGANAQPSRNGLRAGPSLPGSAAAASKLCPGDGAAELWSEVLELLKLRVNREGFDTWLAPTRGRTVENKTIEVEVPNGFFADWISQHYSAEIRAALATLTGQDYALSWRARDVADAASLRRRSAPPAVPPGRNGNRLQARYTFASFIVGENSRFATAAARSVAERPGAAYNPLFLYGGVGLGKTHLLQAIGNHALAVNPALKVRCVAAEGLFLELIQAIEKNSRLEFKHKYRALDLLLLDDVHYLVGKERLQEEVFHIFNHLHDAGSQVVFTSDRPPREIPTLEDRLVSRLGSGLVVDIQAPDLETRVAILKQKAALEDRELPHEVALFVANRVKTSVRELEGCLVRILALSGLTGRPITLDLAEEASRDLLEAAPPVDGAVIIAATAEAFGIPVADIKSPRRTKQLALARQVAMYLLRKTLNMSLKEIGYCFGGKDHTTVMHAVDKVERLRSTDPAIAARIRQLASGISRG
jgi:chromosomal replication initiator protein